MSGKPLDDLQDLVVANLIYLQFPGNKVRLNSLLGLAAVEEAGGEEDDGDHQSQTGVQHVVQAEA